MRYIQKYIAKDLKKKMVFISGPRQVGKTTLAQNLLKEQGTGLYLNWDDPEHRRIIRNRQWTTSDPLLILDEIHKFSRWKNFLKGTYDTQKNQHQFIITGSARLDIDRTRGDSLVGRYHLWRLHPFCLAEHPKQMSVETCFERLLKCGGFPEPFLEGDPIEAKRWARQRLDLVLRGDGRDLERVREVDLLESLCDTLAQRVTSPIAFANLARDLEVAPKTVKSWISILDRLYVCFIVEPYADLLPRAWTKPIKVYFWNTADVLSENSGPKLENLVAQHLLKRIHFLEDRLGDRYSLRYVRDKEGHEVDFLILKNRRPLILFEVKASDTAIHSGLSYYKQKFPGVRAIQLVRDLKKADFRNGIEILPLISYLSRPLDEEL